MSKDTTPQTLHMIHLHRCLEREDNTTTQQRGKHYNTTSETVNFQRKMGGIQTQILLFQVHSYQLSYMYQNGVRYGWAKSHSKATTGSIYLMLSLFIYQNLHVYRCLEDQHRSAQLPELVLRRHQCGNLYAQIYTCAMTPDVDTHRRVIQVAQNIVVQTIFERQLLQVILVLNAVRTIVQYLVSSDCAIRDLSLQARSCSNRIWKSDDDSRPLPVTT